MVVFLRWATDAQFGKLKYVGEDFIEFEILDMDSMEYTETVLDKFPNCFLGYCFWI